MAVEFGTGKTIFILAIVVGCFAVLWPKLFYPMLQASVNTRTPIDSSQASTCCDVIFETDVNAIKIITEMCGNIIHHYDEVDPKLIQAFKQGKLTKTGIETCRNEVLNKCGLDITAFLHENVRLGKTYKQILDEVRSFNSSVCLKMNFGIEPGLLGVPHRMRIGSIVLPRHHRQERPPHLRPDMLHPALRERGRAIPQSHIVPRVVEKEGRPGPIPGMRPPMGGAGHVVPAPKGSGTMGIVMPIYTIGIVVFFMYTIMKVMFKKPGQSSVSYGDFSSDPEFRKMVFSDEYVDDQTNTYGDISRQKVKHETVTPTWKTTEENGTKLGWKERDTRDIEIDHLRKRLEETEAAMERIVAQMGSVPHKLHSSSGTQLIGAKVEDLSEKSKESTSAVQEEEDTKKDLHGSQKALKEEAAPEAAVSSEEEEAVARGEEYGDRRTEFEHMNDAGHGDDVPTTTNYTTASAAAEATGPEETAADYSTLESFGTNDDQQEEELEDEEEVWNGDVDSAEEESEEEEAQAHAIPQTHHHR
ncbi:resistance to inhibitors of cholinesterase protein 3 isoform X8 [Periplaneta americana]|uniref:resistance to inhibitors of cholinesterase protein 3 isoform X8 n=1 Tax=Periplaneta americana TaxID=6978 RepID=UPI0037E78FBA